ncbi:MAG: damage-control phosphatase ARMT1 family protein [Myxococcales bacterium]|jgi:uncharacterized protein with ATP-grasp and redox domains
MRLHPDCLPCFARQIHDLCSLHGSTVEQKLHWSRQALRCVLDADWELSPPEVGAAMHARLAELSGIEDPYADAKLRQNEHLLGRLPELAARVARSPDPLAAALRLSMAGNLIDLGIHPRLREDQVDRAIEEAFSVAIEPERVRQFAEETAAARRILFLADNAGEIVFDRLLLEALPREKTVVAVRGRPVLNDVTLRDAEHVGLTGLVRVISNGAGVPGTSLAMSSPELRRAFAEADLVVSKGQGNYETLHSVDKPIYFLFKLKCVPVQEMLGLPLGTLVFRRQGPPLGIASA